MTEAELATHFLSYFGDWDVYQEVPANGVIDIVAVKDKIRVAVEVKKSLNFEVIEQGRKNTSYAHYSYIAVPHSKSLQYRTGIQIQICKSMGIGILAYLANGWNTKDEVREVLAPRLNRRIIKVSLEDWMKRSVAGSQNDRMTGFKFFREELLKAVRRNNGIDAKDLFKKLPSHYTSLSVFKRCVHAHVIRGVISGIEFLDGKYFIKPDQPEETGK